jgi:hypothetical protein
MLMNVPEKEWPHARPRHILKAKFRKHDTNPCEERLSCAIFVGGDV